MRIDILTIFPNMFTTPLDESIIKRAQTKELAYIKTHDLRQWAPGLHKQVDDRPFGGGPGMVMMIEPIHKALRSIKKQAKEFFVQHEVTNFTSKTILLSAKGERYTQAKAQEFAKLDHLLLICGHYEGVDERVATYLVDQEVSIGDFVLTGGELGALCLVDSIVRLLPGVLGDQSSLNEESHNQPGYLEYPHYTRPAKYQNWSVPSVLLSGNHAHINTWRQQHSHSTKFQKS